MSVLFVFITDYVFIYLQYLEPVGLKVDVNNKFMNKD